ncbi:electron transfer flavoprotein subunit alpha/FixB family protein [Paenibacillus lutimineralis]|uniref:Electron transfer flavoprotein subunit alpha/FixB family protein n=1 Tax=Paenibacillus lutimineralis TaxID=2707005 RepID=A0A3S9UV24_9BACL|nr:electron transfer flavoprotein subunit alpha/FixB family protein [Paenibacillus lutimineralis]AZS14172.1 electron transfer flavoprotein subunit alpha/FixB family protein [Paenibacillus lutimineralis]
MTEEQDHSNVGGIMIIAECGPAGPKPVLYELLGAACGLNAKLMGIISVALIGSGCGGYSSSCIHHGAHQVFLIDHPGLWPLNEEVYTGLLHELVVDLEPEIVLMPSTIHSKSIAARLASRLGTGLTAECTNLDIDLPERTLLQIRPARECSLMATVICPQARPQMATVRPGALRSSIPDFQRSGIVVHRPVLFPVDLRTTVLETLADRAARHSFGEGGIIVAAGRGIGGKNGLELVRELSDVLGADIGATRPVVDMGWLDGSKQIGLTGKHVKGKIYFAVGISGAIQHTVGIRGMDTIIAVNPDKDAPIFKEAHYGIATDMFTALPLLIDKVKQTMKVSRW